MRTRRVTAIDLPAAAMGTARRLQVIHYGRQGILPKAYIQAGLHADEPPGILVMHHLLARLDAADAKGAIRGEILLVPVANPIGSAQWGHTTLQGRFDVADGVNFNREFVDLKPQLAKRLTGRLGDDAKANVALIRRTARDILDAMASVEEGVALKHRLLSLAHDADIVLDLHCDDQAVPHVYLGTPLWPKAADLPAQLGAAVTLLAADSGVTPFDEACSRIWWQLAAEFAAYPIPSACLAATIELGGRVDVSHDIARQDADNLFAFLQRRGLIAGDPPPLPPPAGEATDLRAVAQIRADAPGVVVFLKAPGDRVAAGEAVAEIVNPLLAPDARSRVRPVVSPTEGVLFARVADRFARPGRILAKIAGRKPLKAEGENLLTA
jgi:predicted deacylase